MIKKKSFTAAFTLIELLVVITIIGILASVALPVFNSVQVRGQQTKSLAQAKQIGLALKICAGDNDGVYPKNGVPAIITAEPSNANYAFSALFPTYTTSEKIFGNKLATGYQTGVGPDDQLDPTPVYPPSKTLKQGENVYAYMMGLTDASAPSSPIVFDGANDAQGTYSTVNGAKGAVWLGTKAIVIYLDNHGAVENVDTSTHQVKNVYNAGGTLVNTLDPSTNPNLSTTANKLLNPQ